MALIIEELDIHPRIYGALKKANLQSYGTLLSLSGPDIERQTHLSAKDVSILHTAVAKAVPRFAPVRALQLNNSQCPDKLQIRKLSTGCDALDKFLRGGILNRGITEVVGESASGKTQFCLQLCISVQLPEEMHGLNGGALFVCTEDVFPNKRLMQLVNSFGRKYVNCPVVKKINFTDNIFIEHAADLNDLQFCITKKAPILLSRGKVKLIIIDSVAALFRSDFGLKDMVHRAKLLSSLAGHLHKISAQFGIPIVCVNQVSGVMDKTSCRKVAPALGISWANVVTVRLMLSRTLHTINAPCTNYTGQTGTYSNPVRAMEVMFAPHLSNSVLHYIIDEDGVRGLT